MPPKLHVILLVLFGAVGLFVGGMLGVAAGLATGPYVPTLTSIAGALPDHRSPPVTVPILFLGGGIGGMLLASCFFVKYIPARCPLCGHLAYIAESKEVLAHPAHDTVNIRNVIYLCTACNKLIDSGLALRKHP